MLSLDGVSAALVPVAPERSYLNAVVYDRPEALAAAYDELAAAYAEIGAKWTVWVPPADREASALLERAGHVLDAEPALMGRELAGVERPPDSALSGWTREGTPADVAAVNDRAYSDDTGSFAHALRGLPEGSAHLYTVREAGDAVASAVIADHEGNADVELVAVVPEARGRGLSGKLLAHALADAAERGCETTTLVATALGRPVYERLGYRPVGRLQMWEHRRS
jgi:GNAT superfamily N-acetyltransferase